MQGFVIRAQSCCDARVPHVYCEEHHGCDESKVYVCAIELCDGGDVVGGVPALCDGEE